VTHPAQISTSMWFGPEIEGALATARPHTVFLTAAVDAVQLERALVEEAVEHVFLTEAFNDWVWLEAVLPQLLPRPITVARLGDTRAVRTVLALPYSDHLQLIVRAMPTPWALLLRPTDQVSVGVSYNLLTFPVSAAVRSVPKDYESDRA